MPPLHGLVYQLKSIDVQINVTGSAPDQIPCRNLSAIPGLVPVLSGSTYRCLWDLPALQGSGTDSPRRDMASSPCIEGSAFDAHEGGGRNATDLDCLRYLHCERNRQAKSDGIPGGGDVAACCQDTPARCVQRFGPAVTSAAHSAMAGPNRGRIALPPRSWRRHCLRHRGRWNAATGRPWPCAEIHLSAPAGASWGWIPATGAGM